MTKLLSHFALSFAIFLFFAPALHSQALYSAERNTRIQAGAGVLGLNNDYSQHYAKGVGGWADYDFLKHVGLEAEVHFGGIITPDDIGETSYLVGPRILYHRRRFTGYAKIMVGRGTITNQALNQSSTFNLYGIGGGFEYKATRRINIRGLDFEMQKWPDFEPHTLSPMAVTIGASYVIR